MKTCIQCLVAKDLSEFHKDASRLDKHVSLCKLCAGAKTKAWRLANKERAYQSSRQWALKNHDKVLASSRASRLKNPVPKERAREQCAAWRERNPGHGAAYMRERWKNDRATLRAHVDKYRATHPEVTKKRCSDRYYAMTDNTIKHMILANGNKEVCPEEAITQELIQAKRAELKLMRLLRQLRRSVHHE